MSTFLLGLLLSIVSAPEIVIFVFYETIAQSVFHAFLMMIAISIGGTAGSTAIYLAARLVGQKRCLDLLGRHGRRILLKSSDLESIIFYYEKWGGLIVFFGRWLPTFRSLISIPAGLSGMALWRFMALTFLGTLTWNFILCSMLYGFSAYLDYLEFGLEGYIWTTFTAVLLIMVYFIVRRISERILKGSKIWNHGPGDK